MEGWSRCNWSRRLDSVYCRLQREPPHGTTIMTKNSEAEKEALSAKASAFGALASTAPWSLRRADAWGSAS